MACTDPSLYRCQHTQDSDLCCSAAEEAKAAAGERKLKDNGTIEGGSRALNSVFIPFNTQITASVKFTSGRYFHRMSSIGPRL